MDVLTLMKGFSDKLRESERALTRLEKRAKTLSEKQAVSDTERESIEQQIQDRETSIEAAQGDRESLLGETGPGPASRATPEHRERYRARRPSLTRASSSSRPNLRV